MMRASAVATATRPKLLSSRDALVTSAMPTMLAVIAIASVFLIGCSSGSRGGGMRPVVSGQTSGDGEGEGEGDLELGREEARDDRESPPGDDGRPDSLGRREGNDDRRPDSLGRREGDDGQRREQLGRRADDDGQRREQIGGPPIAQVLVEAYAAAGLDGRLPGHLPLRARLGGLVPWVSVRTGRDTTWHEEDPDVGRGTTLEVRATWRLDRLVFDGRELQVVALEAARRRERRRLATQVIRTYFLWKRSASRSRAEEAAAELDALTAGWFSGALQRTASEARTAEPGRGAP